MSPDELEKFQLAEAASSPPERDASDALQAEHYLTELLREEPDLYEDPADLEEELREALLEAYPDATPAEIEESLFNVLVSLAPAESITFRDAPSPTERRTAGALTVPPGGQTETTAFPPQGGVAGGSVVPDGGFDNDPDSTAPAEELRAGTPRSGPRGEDEPAAMIDRPADDLTVGALGDRTRELHARLASHGFEVSAAEQQRGFFGPETLVAVRALQQANGLTPTGVVDTPTLAVLSATAPASGGAGAATATNGKQLPSGTVVGTPPPAQRAPGGGPTAAPSGDRSVSGRILLEHGVPAANVRLRIYQRGFGGAATLLTEVQTDERGLYNARYGVPKGLANIEVRAVAADREIPLSRTKFAVGDKAVLNLVVPASFGPLASEYARLSAEVTREIGSMAQLAGARETAERQDLAILTSSTGWDARVLALAANAAALSADQSVGLQQDVLYGLFRAGLPTDKQLLALVDEEAIGRALVRSRDAGIIQLTDQQIAEAQKQFSTFARATRLATPAPGSASTYDDLLKASPLKDETDRATFASVFFKHREDPAALWQEVRAAGLGEEHVQKLQVQGKLAYLTGNSHALTARLQEGMKISDPAQLVDHDLFQADRWKEEITALSAGGDVEKLIPPAYGGDTVDARLDAYAQDMARKIRRTYPTHVAARIIEQDQGDVMRLGAGRQATVTLLKNAASQGFKLGETPVESFLASHAGVTAGMSTSELKSAKQQMQTAQRAYQISPTDEDMTALMRLGLTSGYDVTAMTEAAFMKLFGPHFPSEASARMVYHRAKQVTSLTYNLFTIARKLDAELPVFGLSGSPEVRETVKDNLRKHFPTMESLFGSMDFCECEHCRSVLSPAAYFVDLLQFVDPEPEVWSGFLGFWNASHSQPYTTTYKEPYAALTERRPDLPYIRLTCENTHTAMPYIDVVNEILEYYVANDGLAPGAARDTASATTAELLAEPQYITRQAYDTVRDARYPLTLPFDLWIETVRRFCDYFETPLWRVLKVFRASDELFVSAQRYDRAAVFFESLGLSRAELAIYADDNPLPRWHELYGFPSALSATTVAVDADTRQRIDLNSAKALARRLDVTYKQLTEIVQTGFANPRLDRLVVLYKIGASIHSVKLARDPANATLYAQNKDLLDRDRGTLPAGDQARYEALSQDQWQTLKELQAFDKRLEEFTTEFHLTPAQVEAELQAIPYDSILLLADTEAGCDFDQTTLRYASGRAADDIAFLRLNLFVRLWRKLGWTIEETDRALQAFVPANAPFEPSSLNRRPLETALLYLAHLDALEKQVKVGKQSRVKLLTLWSDLPTTGRNPLYAQLFLTPTILKSDDVFNHPLGQYLSVPAVEAMAQSRWHEVDRNDVGPAQKIDPAAVAAVPRIRVTYDDLQEVQHLSYQGVLTDADKATLAALSSSPVLPGLLDDVQTKAREFPLVKGHLLALQGALGLTADEVRRILEDAELSLDTAPLSLPNVSLLYRYGLLAKALKLSVTDLIALKQLSGLNPFRAIQPDPPTTIAQDAPFSHTLRFIEVAGHVREAGVTVDDLDYLLRHRFDPTGKYRPDAAGTLSLVKTLSEGVRAIRAEHAVPDDPGAMSEDVLRQKLGLVLPADVVGRLLSMMNGTAEFTAVRAGVSAADQLQPGAFEGEAAIREVRYNPTSQEQKLTFRGVLFDPEKALLLGRLPKPEPPSPHVPSATLGALLDDVQQQARAFFDKHLQKQAPNVQPVSGFLDAADFTLLFTPASATDSEDVQQQHIRNQRKRLALAFLPFLQERLIRQLIVQTLTADTGGEPALVESLATDTRLLGEPQTAGDPVSLLTIFAATGARGVQATFYPAAEGTGAASGSAVLEDADTELKDAAGNPRKPAGTNSVSFEGYLEVPAPGPYRFFVALGKQDATAELRFDHLPNPVFWTGTAATNNALLGDQAGQYLELKPGILYRFALHARNLAGGDARLLVQSETLPRDTIKRLVLYPLSAVEHADRALVLLTKAQQLVQTLGLSERELRHLLTHSADFGNVDLKKLPTRPADDTVAGAMALFSQFLRLAAYARLKRDLSSGTDDLIEIFEANEAGDLDAVYAVIGKLTRRDVGTVKATAKALAPSPAFASEQPVQRLWEALQIVERFGVPVGSLVEWIRVASPGATPEQRFDVARDLKEAIKARFDPETWQRVAQPIFDALRARQRDALVAHVMHQKGFARMEELYEYFLIDPGMEPVVQTSRIRLAIASVQLFVQRCLLNLEREVHPTAIVNASQWEWMQRYRVWEANRKIFLFPENWLEPEFRDDKTHLFSELESALLEGDVSSDLVEDAFLTYLRKLDVLARLDIVAMHLEDAIDPADRALHVFGRTHKEPFEYFYRRYAGQAWTPWEPVNTDIKGDHLAPVVWRDRLYLFWVTFMEQPNAAAGPPVGPADSSGAERKAFDLKLSEIAGSLTSLIRKRSIEVHLHWIEHVQGEWSAPESGGESAAIVKEVTAPFNPSSVFVHVTKDERGVYIHLGGQIHAAFYLAGRNSKPIERGYLPPPEMKFTNSSVRPTEYQASGPLSVTFNQRISSKPDGSSRNFTAQILEQGDTFAILPCNNDLTPLVVSAEASANASNPAAVVAAVQSGLPEILALMKPVFYKDEVNTLFIEPSVSERTVEEWQEWVTQTPVPEPGWHLPDWFDDVVIVPEVPWKEPRPGPGDPWLEVDPDALVTVKRVDDWLVNPVTALSFDGSLVGATGRSPITILQSMDVATAVAGGAIPVALNAGSDVGPATSVIVAGASSPETDLLTHTTATLNVVGASGFNATLGQNVNSVTMNLGAIAGPNAAAGAIGSSRRTP